ncbi:MAG: hypothetical protein ACRDSG_16145, partial [Pseudonocardiaceae bacterium]
MTQRTLISRMGTAENATSPSAGPARRGLLLRVLVSCLAPLAACGTVESTATPTALPSVLVPTTTTATTSPDPAPPTTPAGITVVLDPGHNGANASHPAEINRPVPNGRGGTKPCNTTGTATNRGYPEHAFTWDV